MTKNESDILFDKTKTSPQETSDFQMNRTFEIEHFDFAIKVKEGNWLVGVTSLDVSIHGFDVSEGNNTFSLF